MKDYHDNKIRKIIWKISICDKTLKKVVTEGA